MAHSNTKFFKSLDIYGRPVRLMIHGNEFWRTELGSIFTLCTYIIVIIFGTTTMIRFLSTAQPNIIINPEPVNLNLEMEPLNLKEQMFYIQLITYRLRNDSVEKIENIEEFGTFTAQIEYKTFSNETKKFVRG